MQRSKSGRFVKRSRTASPSRAMVISRPRGGSMRRRSPSVVVVKQAARRTARRARGAVAGMNWKHLAVGAAAISYLASAKGPQAIKTMAAKIPGSTTFGPAATIGLSCLAVDKWVKPNRYLRAAGWAGVVLAAAQFGSKGADFKWVGDDGDDVADLDISGDDDDE